MIDGQTLERIYMESLEENIILHLAKVKGISLEETMDIYYSSKLSKKIQSGGCGIQYLDHKTLCDILLKIEQ